MLQTNGKCRAKGAFRNLRNYLDEALDELLEPERFCTFDDKGDELSCEIVDYISKRPAALRIAVTQLSPLPKGLLVDSFTSLVDLKQSLIASCAIPFYFARTPTVMFRGLFCSIRIIRSHQTYPCPLP